MSQIVIPDGYSSRRIQSSSTGFYTKRELLEYLSNLPERVQRSFQEAVVGKEPRSKIGWWIFKSKATYNYPDRGEKRSVSTYSLTNENSFFPSPNSLLCDPIEIESPLEHIPIIDEDPVGNGEREETLCQKIFNFFEAMIQKIIEFFQSLFSCCKTEEIKI